MSRPQPTDAQRQQAQQRATDAGAQTRDRAAQTGTTMTDRSTIDQLNRDAAARTTGTQRTGDYGSYRSSGGSTRSGSTYRPSSGSMSRGGGMRGGGGGRRR